MRNPKEFFVHLRLNDGAVTLCVKDQLTVGVSFCSPKEQFNRKLGRTIARGRAEKADRPGVLAFQLLKETDEQALTRDFVEAEFHEWLQELTGDELPRWLGDPTRAHTEPLFRTKAHAS